MGNSLTWQGRELTAFGSVTFDYDMNGMRTAKGNTAYTYIGSALYRETNGANVIEYLYNQNGLVGFTLNGTSYYYISNMLGDVTGIIDGTGNLVVQYTYDSWGKVLTVGGALASTVGAANPIRYRGYYYDTETGLYYLVSRYYDPETGRFISPDVVAEEGNLYAYCVNDPVNRADDSGCLSIFGKRIVKLAVDVVATTTAAAITIATGGALLPIVAGVLSSTIINGVISAGIAALNGESEEDILEAGIDGLCDGFMWGGVFALGGAILSSAVNFNSVSKIYMSTNKVTATSGFSVQSGNVRVYHALKGSQNYYGITNNLARRSREHSRNGIKIIECLDGSFSRNQAKGVEQFLIEQGGLNNLANKINSISIRNPNYVNLTSVGKRNLGVSRWIPFG